METVYIVVVIYLYQEFGLIKYKLDVQKYL